ncbi:MAG: Hsp20 family protein [Kiloniellaceae bacterium]
MFRALDGLEQAANADLGYPPYDIETTGGDACRITIAVAGFQPDELSVEAREHELVVAGDHKRGDAPAKVARETPSYLHRGIANRAFRRAFRLADFVRVADAHLANGLLHIDLVREVPAAMKPRRIEISTSGPARIAAKAKKLVESIKKAA